ncbi:MAG TPA: hypothetical protein VGE27_10615 [Gemmatimonas sp.]|uniref:hypothetical protein n=1 Tax=Gemmatimonas sp. TaxID=1962908 RepID=UPI002ED9186B
MSHSIARRALAVTFVTLALPMAALQAQQPPAKTEPAKAAPAMDHNRMDHGAMHGAKADAWKELDAYHMLMMATWHPAKQNNDMAPIRAKVGEMVAAAKVVAASKAPASCQKPELLKAQAGLTAETEKVATLVNKKASDADLKTALGTLHEKFEVLEEGCNTGMKH